MKKNDIEKLILEQGLAQMPNLDIESIASRVAIGSTEQKAVKKKKQPRIIAYAAVILVVIIGMFWGTSVYYTDPQTEIIFEINPSFSLAVSAAQKVVGYEALNADAEALFDANQIEDKPLDEAYEYILETLDNNGYLEEDVTINMEIKGKNTRNVDKIETRLREMTENRYRENNINGSVNSNKNGKGNVTGNTVINGNGNSVGNGNS